MTARQREFCRHYLRGLPARKAAEAAGYAQSTAERNAADILASDSVLLYLERHRRAAPILTRNDLERSRARLLALLEDADSRTALAAARELRQLARTQAALDLPLDIDIEIDVDKGIDTEKGRPGKASEKPEDIFRSFQENGPQPAGTEPDAKTEKITETDTKDRYDFSDLSTKDLLRTLTGLGQMQAGKEQQAHALEQARLEGRAQALAQYKAEDRAIEQRRKAQQQQPQSHPRPQAPHVVGAACGSPPGIISLPTGALPVPTDIPPLPQTPKLAPPLTRQQRRAAEREQAKQEAKQKQRQTPRGAAPTPAYTETRMTNGRICRAHPPAA